jgi:hypothetical protein
MKFRYTNNTGEQVSGEIYDLYGAFVNRMQNKSDLSEYLEWNGRDQAGGLVKKGIYIYKLKVGNSYFTGTVIVAR